MCIGRRPHKGSFKGICKDMSATSEVRNAKVSDSSAAPVCHAWQASRIEFDRVSIQGGTASATPISAATGALCADGGSYPQDMSHVILQEATHRAAELRRLSWGRCLCEACRKGGCLTTAPARCSCTRWHKSHIGRIWSLPLSSLISSECIASVLLRV